VHGESGVTVQCERWCSGRNQVERAGAGTNPEKREGGAGVVWQNCRNETNPV